MPRFNIDGVWYDALNYAAARQAAKGGATPASGVGRKVATSPAIVRLWSAQTARLMTRSAELRTLDAALAKWAADGPGVADANLLDAFDKHEAWKTAQGVEVAAIKAASDELETGISDRYHQGKSQLTNVVSTHVKPAGWTHIRWTQAMYPWTQAVAANDRLNDDLSTAETMRMNESLRRAKLAATYARDAMARIVDGSASTTETTAFTSYFGAIDAARAQKIRHNFNVLAMAFEAGPDIVDLRNTAYGKTCYAACFRKSISGFTRGTILTLTGKVDMFLGRAFFAKGSYEKSSDTTVTTLIHEFAHGAVDAVDVPPVDATGTFTHGRKSDVPGHADFGETMTNSIQASTKAADMLLATHKPEYAAVSADAYGQFATALLLDRKG